MGSLVSSFSSESNHNDEDKFSHSIKPPRSSDRTVLEDINKLSQQELEYEFDKMYKSSSGNLHPVTFINPCENLVDAIKTCATKHPQDLTRCFEEMRKYRQCVYQHIHDRLEAFTEGENDRPTYEEELKCKDLTEVKNDKSRR